MKYFVIRVCWSQTDSENVVIEAITKEEAVKFAKDKWCSSLMGAHHVDFVCTLRSNEVYGIVLTT